MPKRPLALLVLSWMLLPAKLFATELGLPTAGVHQDPVALKVSVAVDSTQYSLQDNATPANNYTGSFLQGEGVVSVAIQNTVELNFHDGAGNWRGYSQPGGGPEGAYRTYGGGIRLTAWHSDENAVQVGGGLQFAWWQKAGYGGTDEIEGGDHQELVGFSFFIPPGTAIYGGGYHYSIGSGLAVLANVNGNDVRLTGDGYGLYGGVQFRLAFLTGRVEAKAQAPDFTNTGLGASIGYEF